MYFLNLKVMQGEAVGAVGAVGAVEEGQVG